MGGSSADKASATDLRGNQALGDLQSRNAAYTDPTMRGLMAQYGSGQISLQDALKGGSQAQVADPNAAKRSELSKQLADLKAQSSDFRLMASTGGGLSAAQIAGSKLAGVQKELDSLGAAPNQAAAQSQFMDNLATDPLTGTRMATDQVMDNQVLGAPLKDLGQNFSDDRNSLLGRDESYGLQDSDLKAYGQASGDIGRQFASQDQNLSQALADRGLASGANGAAGQAFAGQYGNKMEQLAGLQTQIAQNRIQTAQGLAQFRMNTDMQRAQLGQQAVNQQYGRQLAGAENNYNQQASTADMNMNNQNLQQNVNNSQWQQNESSTFHPLNALTTLAGAGLGAATGGIGTGIGSALGNKLGAALFPTPAPKG